MRTCDLTRAIRQIRKVAFVENGESMTDGQLLESFLTRGEEAAFEAIVHRHGPMVLGVCQRLLHNTHDAEDAFQATFLVLIRKARTIMPREMVGHWLYGVAYRTALEARTLAYKRHTKEMERGQMANTQGQQQHEWSELQSLLDREITGLPKKYRMPIVLCDLEGKTRKEAAGLLHLPEGTLSTRLSRGRGLLAKRLTRRGLALTSASLAGALGQNAAASVPSSLVQVTVKAGAVFAAGQVLATGIISPTVLTLMKGVMKTMFLTKLKLATAVVFAVGLIGTVNFMAYRSLAAAQQAVKKDGQDPPLANDPTRPSDQVLSNDGEKEDKEKKETNQSQPEKPGGSKEGKTNDLPQRSLPSWVSVTADQEGRFLVASPLVTYETRYTKIKKDGEEIDAYYYEPDVKEYVQPFESSEVRAFNVQGRPIDTKEFRKLLAKKTLVLASSDGRKVPPFYLRIIKEDTLVLVFSKTLITANSPPSAEPTPLSKEVKVVQSNGPPNGPAPFWVRASTDKEGKFIVGTPVVTYKTGTAKIKENGKEKEVYYFDPVATENVMNFDSEDVQVFTVEGKAVDPKEVEKLLAGKKTVVLASSDGRKVDPFYLRIIKEGTLVLVIPKSEFADQLRRPLYDRYYPPPTTYRPE